VGVVVIFAQRGAFWVAPGRGPETVVGWSLTAESDKPF